jgi:hypothetical protein
MRRNGLSFSTRIFAVGAALAVALSASATTADAGMVTVQAFTNAEVRQLGAPSTDNGTIGNTLPSGLRQFAGNPNGTSTLFQDPEGTANGQFAAFAVEDFQLPKHAGVTGVTSATLTLFEAPAFFAHAGTIQVYLLNNTDPNLISVASNPASGVPAYQSGNNGLAAIDPNFNPSSTLLGSATFTPTGTTGSPTTASLTFTGPDLTTLLAALHSGGDIRLGVTPGDANVAGTFAGQGFTGASPPTLSFSTTSPVPEPSTLALVIVGLGTTTLGLWRRRCSMAA